MLLNKARETKHVKQNKNSKTTKTKKYKFEFFTWIDTKIDSMKLLSEKKMGGKNVNNPEGATNDSRDYYRSKPVRTKMSVFIFQL